MGPGILTLGRLVNVLPGGLILASALGACTGAPEVESFSVRDSAGVAVAESRAPVWEVGEGWIVGPEPILRLGVVEGDAHLQFHGLTGMARLPDGSLVVADGGSQEVRFFDVAGILTARFGGPGEGPGEFSGLSGLGSLPDGTVWAYDFLLRRITWLTPTGALDRLATLDAEPPMLNPVGPLPDGTFLLKQLWGASAVAEAGEAGLRRDPIAMVRVDAQGGLVDTLGLFPGREVYLTQEDGRGVMGSPLMGRNAVGAPWEEGVAVGIQNSFQVLRYSPEGELMRIARIPEWDTTLRPEDVQDVMAARLADVPDDQRPAARREMESTPLPDSKPAHGGFLADEVGNLWVSEWASYPLLPSRWTVLAPDGRWLGSVSMPPRFFPFAAGEDWILGAEWDELDVEYVVLYPLVKKDPARAPEP